ncbi:MAG: GspE/PulE family protein [Candidatus Paceibacterota bacterium]|jgi:type IV pilus assembly protein PilB
MDGSDAQLKSFLLDSRLISKADLEVAESEAIDRGSKLQDIIVGKGLVTEDDLRRVKAHMLGIPFVDLKKEKVAKEILSLIPEPIARKHNIIAYRRSDIGLEVAMLDPLDLEAIDFLKKSLSLKVLPRLTDGESMSNLLVQYQKSLKAEFGDIISREAKMIGREGEVEDAEGLKKLAEDLPVVKIVDSLLSHAILQKASDIHIEPYEKELIIRYRIDGLLHDAMILPKGASAGVIARIKVLSNLRLDEKRLPQDGRFKIENDNQRVAFRVSILPTYFGEKIVMRLLPDSVSGFTLEGLGFHGQWLERIQRATKSSVGMILVTGPTGSGKTTTLYTVLDILNQPDVNISTVEDPIEYQLPRVNQTQVKPEIGLTFGSGLRALVRQDPDIIMVGEIRDKETANLAINAALTGHLVLSTLHTNSASGSIPRFLDMGAEPFLLVSTLNIVIAQRLVRKLIVEKTEKYFLSEAEIKELDEKIDMDRVLEALVDEKIVPEKTTWKKVPFYRPLAGEDEIYSGRIGIHEVLEVSRAIKDMIMKNATADEIEDQAKKEGMITMMEDGIFKAAMGVTTIEEVYRATAE